VTPEPTHEPLSATGLRRRVLAARVIAAKTDEDAGRVIRLRLSLQGRGGVRIEPAAADEELCCEEIDAGTFAAGGVRTGHTFARLLVGLMVDDVSILGTTAHARPWSVILNPGPPRSFLVRTRAFPGPDGGLAFFAEDAARAAERDEPDAYSLLTGELMRGTRHAPRSVAP